MESFAINEDRHPTISLPLSRVPSRANSEPDGTHLASPTPRPTSPPPKGYKGKSSIFALIRRSGGTLDSVSSFAAAGISDDDLPTSSTDTPAKKGKGKGRDRWSKRASRKAPPPPPPIMPGRERGESEEVDWERIRTLPRVRLVPPEDEGEPIMLYPIPHPSSLLPLLPRPPSPPTLLKATVAATFANTDPSTPSSPPSQTPPRPSHSSPPEGIVLNSLAHATFMAQQQHGHWIGMSDKFILPPPIFTRGGSGAGGGFGIGAAGRPGPPTSRGIVMPKTRRQVEADIGRRMSTVEQRKRDSLELERNALLPPMEEATQSPPNIMLPPLLRSIAEDGDFILQIDEAILAGDEDLPLAAIKRRSAPISPGTPHQAEIGPVPVMTTIRLVKKEDIPDPAPQSPIMALPNPYSPDLSPKAAVFQPLLGPAIELKSPPTRSSSRARISTDDTPPPLVVQIIRPPVAPIPLPTPPPPPPAPGMELPPVPHAAPRPSPPAAATSNQSRPDTEIRPQAVTRPKRSKSLTAALSRSMSDDGPSSSTGQQPPLPVPALRRQKSLKKLFFPATTSTAVNVPPVPVILDNAADQGGRSKRSGLEIQRDQDDLQGQAMSTQIQGRKKGLLSRAKSKPSLRIEVAPPGTNGQNRTSEEDIAPGLTTASTTDQGEVSPFTPDPALGVNEAARHGPSSRNADRTDRAQGVQSAGGIRGLSKRFSLSNMSGAFRKKASISTMVALPSESNVPSVPDLPDVYRSSAMENRKGKQRDISVGMEAERPVRRKRKSVDIAQLLELAIRDAEVKDNETSQAGPSGTSYQSDSLDDGETTLDHSFDMIDPDLNYPILPPSPLASSEGGACGRYLSNRESLILPPVNYRLLASQPAHSEVEVETETSSISNNSSLADTNDSSIIHAHLMQVSPTTRRNPGVSLQDFLGSAPLPQTGALISSPTEKRRSVMAVVQGVASSPNQSNSEVPEEKESGEVQVQATAQIKNEDTKKAIQAEIRAPGPLVIDLRGQYLKRSIGPSGSRGAHQVLERILADIPIVGVSVQPVQEPEPSSDVPSDEPIEGDETASTSDSDKDELSMPTTPMLEVDMNEMPDVTLPLGSDDADTSQSSSIDSGLVIIDTPLPPSPELVPIDQIGRAALATGSRSSTPRSRFTTPEALLRLLASPLAASRLSRHSMSTPGSNASGKGKKAGTAQHSGNQNLMAISPILNGVEGLPIPRDGAELNWSALMTQTQLGSLHFDDLGLDLAFSEEG